MKKLLASLLILASCILCSCNNYPPCDPDATNKTTRTLRTMRHAMRRGVMIGHEDALTYGIGWAYDMTRCDFCDVTGSYPALFGCDIGRIELRDANNLDNVNFAIMRRNIIRADSMGGINTISWHVRNPLTGNNAWDISRTDIADSILTRGTTANKRFDAYLNNLSKFMLSLRSADGELIPIIFRPFNELTGNWFWWGNIFSAESFKELWRYTFGYLRSKGVHNILATYSTSDFDTVEAFAERYPGDEWVDIVGFELFYKGSPKHYIEQFRQQAAIADKFAKEHGKIWAFTETGYEKIPDYDWFTTVLAPALEESGCSYALLWRNAFNRPNHFFAAYPGHPSADDMKQFTELKKILTLDDLKRLH